MFYEFVFKIIEAFLKDPKKPYLGPRKMIENINSKKIIGFMGHIQG